MSGLPFGGTTSILRGLGLYLGVATNSRASHFNVPGSSIILSHTPYPNGYLAVPVTCLELSITEKAFLPNLMPILATVSLGMRVLSVDDLGFEHKGGSLFMNYLQSKESLSDRYSSVGLNSLGIGEIP